MPTGTVTVVVIILCKPGIGSSVRSVVAPPFVPADPRVARDSPVGGAAIAFATKAPPVCGRTAFAAPPESVERDSVAGEPLLPAVLGAAKGSFAISSIGV